MHRTSEDRTIADVAREFGRQEELTKTVDGTGEVTLLCN